MQTNLNHFMLVGWSWRPVCSLSGWLLLCRCVCLCGPQLCFRCAFFVRLHFLPTRVCVSPGERSGDDGWTGRTLSQEVLWNISGLRGRVRGWWVEGGWEQAAAPYSLFYSALPGQSTPPPPPLSPDPLPRHHNFGSVEKLCTHSSSEF